jgi:hypothetical protein
MGKSKSFLNVWVEDSNRPYQHSNKVLPVKGLPYILKIWGGKKTLFQGIFKKMSLFDIFSETQGVLVFLNDNFEQIKRANRTNFYAD